jgi:hypothetical protein
MSPLPRLNEGELDLVVAYSPDSQEEMIEAVVNAFLAADVDVFEKPTALKDWVDPEILSTPQWSSRRSLYLCLRVWDHRVVITPDEVRIYTPPVTS